MNRRATRYTYIAIARLTARLPHRVTGVLLPEIQMALMNNDRDHLAAIMYALDIIPDHIRKFYTSKHVIQISNDLIEFYNVIYPLINRFYPNITRLEKTTSLKYLMPITMKIIYMYPHTISYAGKHLSVAHNSSMIHALGPNKVPILIYYIATIMSSLIMHTVILRTPPRMSLSKSIYSPLKNLIRDTMKTAKNRPVLIGKTITRLYATLIVFDTVHSFIVSITKNKPKSAHLKKVLESHVDLMRSHNDIVYLLTYFRRVLLNRRPFKILIQHALTTVSYRDSKEYIIVAIAYLLNKPGVK